MTVELVDGPPGVGKSFAALKADRAVFGKCALLQCDEHGHLSDMAGEYAVYDGFENLLVVDRSASASVVVNYASMPTIESSGVQREQDLITASDDLRQNFMTQRGFDNVHEHPWVQEGLTFAFDVMATLGLALWQLAYVFWFGHPEHLEIVARMPRFLRDKLATFEQMTKSERERVLGAAIRLIWMALRGPCLRERFDRPGAKLDIDRHFANRGILTINGRGASHEQYRTHALLIIMRAIVGAMRHGYPLKITIDEATPLITPWLIRKCEEIRKFDISISLLIQHLPSDPDIRGRLLKASQKRVWYACPDPEERKIAALDLIRLLNRNKRKWTEERFVSLRGPVVDTERVTVSQSDNGMSGSDRRVTKGKSVTKIDKQMWETLIQRIPHFESGHEQLFWLEQDLFGLEDRSRYVVWKNKVWFERTKLIQATYPGCPGLGRSRYLAALERIESRPYYRMPQPIEDHKGAACRLQRIQSESSE